jgi:hypothetical protein
MSESGTKRNCARKPFGGSPRARGRGSSWLKRHTAQKFEIKGTKFDVVAFIAECHPNVM